MVQFDDISSVKFEILFPSTYFVDPDDPTEVPKPVQISEIQNYLAEFTTKYGGYTISNPYGPPPVAGGYQGGSLELNFWVTLIIPSYLMERAAEEIKQMISHFQTRYYQKELLAYYYLVNRWVPRSQPSEGGT